VLLSTCAVVVVELDLEVELEAVVVGDVCAKVAALARAAVAGTRGLGRAVLRRAARLRS